MQVLRESLPVSVTAARSAARPNMLYDYGGFPPHTYNLHYGSSGAPELADRVLQLLDQAGIQAREDDQHGYGYGMFAPMAVIYPQGDVPVL